MDTDTAPVSIGIIVIVPHRVHEYPRRFVGDGPVQNSTLLLDALRTRAAPEKWRRRAASAVRPDRPVATSC